MRALRLGCCLRPVPPGDGITLAHPVRPAVAPPVPDRAASRATRTSRRKPATKPSRSPGQITAQGPDLRVNSCNSRLPDVGFAEAGLPQSLQNSRLFVFISGYISFFPFDKPCLKPNLCLGLRLACESTAISRGRGGPGGPPPFSAQNPLDPPSHPADVYPGPACR